MGSGGDLGLGGLVRLGPYMPVLLFVHHCIVCSGGLQVQSWTVSNCNSPKLFSLSDCKVLVYVSLWQAMIATIAGSGWYEHGKP